MGQSSGSVTSSYATGDVTGDIGVGGLVGGSVGAITSSYATGDVTGDHNVGGLVGIGAVGIIITSSYYNLAAVVTQDGDAVGPDAYARSVTELASVPTADAPGIFADWAVSANGNSVSFDDKRIVWDFGTAIQYPVLCSVDANEDGIFTSAEFGTQPRDTGIEDAYVYFSQPEFTVGEEDGEVVVSVVMFNAPADAVMLTVLVSDGTALSPDDYRGSGAVALSFAASPAKDLLTTATFTITIHSDNELELDETIALSFDALPTGVVSAEPSMATALIVDDEARFAYDTDDDGLIEVHTVEQLNAIRCDLNGDGEIDDLTSNDPAVAGSKAAAYVAAFHGILPPDEVTYGGYELAVDLDFAGSKWALDATADGILDAVAEGWAPIGGSSNPYRSTFNGNGHTITGLYINRPNTGEVGLFGYAGAGARIRNVGLEEVEVTASNYVGSLAGHNEGTIASSYATGTVTGTDHVGGLVGLSKGSIASSYATGAVTGSGGDESMTGGLVGRNDGTITSSYATGAVSGENIGVGGLVGFTDGSSIITFSYATGAVMSTGGSVGGLVGNDSGTITSSYATGTVTGAIWVGGLVGFGIDIITASYSTGDVSGGDRVDGLVGGKAGTIRSSYYSSAAVVTQDGAPVPPNDYARLAVELARVPTADAPGIYEDWAVDTAGNAHTLDSKRIVWDFGTNVQYPVLCPVDVNRDGFFTSAEFGTQPRDIDTDIEGIYVYFSQPEFVVGEEDGTATVSVVMFNAPADAVTVTVLCSGNTATPSDDYVRGNDAIDLSFDASAAVDFLTTATFTIPIEDDGDLEVDETISLSFSDLPDGVVLAEPITATVVILDDELRSAYDADGDGLIDVHDLEQLNVIRYDVNGDGEIDDRTSANPNVPVSKAAAYVRAFGYGLFPPAEVTYRGYELATALDFANTRWMRDATGAGIPDAVAEGWKPIGPSTKNPYTAIFNGNGHTITGLYINRPSTDQVGLFGVLNGTILNVGLEEVYVHGLSYVGSLAGWSDGSITSSYATGTVMGADYVGGLVGISEGTIASSYAMSTVSGVSYVGGLVGTNRKSITSSYSTGDVSGNGGVGGLVGLSEGTIMASYSTGDVSGRNSVGGLMGISEGGTIRASYSTGDVSGRNTVGGLMGFSEGGTITSSYSTGDVSGSSTVGGLVGGNEGGTIRASYYSSTAVVTKGGNAVPPDDYARSIVRLASVPTADDPGVFVDWALDAAGKKEDSDGTAYTLDDKHIVWDFGTNTQYPVLCPVDADGDGYFTSAEFGTQPRDIAGTYVDFSQPEFTVGEADGKVVVSVVMLNAPDTAVDVSVLVSDGTALSPADYMRGSGAISLSFDSSSAVDLLTTATFTIPIIDDRLREEDETIALSLDVNALPSGVTLAVPGTATVVILDDELRIAYDADGDGLIEVRDTEQLNVIRYDLDGDGEMDDRTSADPNVPGSKAAAYVSAFHGFFPPESVTYRGYELAADLDFENTRWALNATAIGISGAVAEGWEPIGNFDLPYRAIFDGAGHTITGLCINRPTTDHVGLFGATKAGAIIRHVGLEEVAVHGGDRVGGLVGQNNGSITSSYATGTVMGADYVGGLVGGTPGTVTSSYATATVEGSYWVGGLTGIIVSGDLISSYAAGAVTGVNNVGGLVGEGVVGSITASYATGDVVGDSGVGGLVGRTLSNSITASYATGDVAGNSDVGGLVGDHQTGLIEASYYLLSAVVTRKGVSVSPDDTARTTMALASSTLSEPALNDASGMPSIFADWGTPVDADGDASTTDVAVWDFGARNQFPVLRIDVNGDSMFSADEFGVQPREASSVVYFPSAEFVVVEEDGQVTVSVVMFNAPADAVNISVLVSDGTATAPDDYARDSGTVSLSFDCILCGRLFNDRKPSSSPLWTTTLLRRPRRSPSRWMWTPCHLVCLRKAIRWQRYALTTYQPRLVSALRLPQPR